MGKKYQNYSLFYLPPFYWFRNYYVDTKIDKIIDINEGFIKESYYNQALIIAPNNPLILKIPIICQLNGSLKEIKIDHQSNMNILMKHWKAIQNSYNNSPFFEYYKEDMGVFFTIKKKFLVDVTLPLLIFLLKKLSLPIPQIVDDGKTNILPTIKTIKEPYYPTLFNLKGKNIEDLSILDYLFCKDNRIHSPVQRYP